MLGYYLPCSICGAEFELPRSIVTLTDLLINFRVHPFDDDHLISDERHAALLSYY